jgi:hypothetical protein
MRPGGPAGIFWLPARAVWSLLLGKWAQSPWSDFKEERMTNKTGAGLLRSGVGNFLLGLVLASGGWDAEAQEPATVPAEPAAVAASAGTAESAAPAAPLEYTYPKRLAELKMADVEQLRQELADTEAKLDEVDIGAANARVQAARDQAQAGSAEVKALQAQITALYEQISQAIDRDPAVVAAAADANRTHVELMDRLNLRTGLLKLIAEKERQSQWTEPASAPQENTP